MQSVNKDVPNIRDPDVCKTDAITISHNCSLKYKVYPGVTLAYSETEFQYKYSKSRDWVKVPAITSYLDQESTINCVSYVKFEDTSLIVVGGSDNHNTTGQLWVLSSRSGRLVRNHLTTLYPITSLSCFTNSGVISDDGVVVAIGMRPARIYLTYINPRTGPCPKQKPLSPVKYIDDISSPITGPSHPYFEVGAAAHRRDGWHYIDPYLKSGGHYPNAYVTALALFDEFRGLLVGYSTGGWQIWSIASSKADLYFTFSITPGSIPVSHFGLLSPENDPHNMLYLWVVHSREGGGEYGKEKTLASMYQLQFKHLVVGNKPGVNDRYRRLIGILMHFQFKLSDPLFIGKETGTFKRLVEFDCIKKMVVNSGTYDFNGIILTIETSKFILTIMFDLNAWYFAQMPPSPNPIARLSPYVSYIPVEKGQMARFCCLQGVYVHPESLYRRGTARTEAGYVFPCTLNTTVTYHLGSRIMKAFYFSGIPSTTTSAPSDDQQQLVKAALDARFSKLYSMSNSNKGKRKLCNFLVAFLPELNQSVNEAMNPMLSGIAVAEPEIKLLRHLVCVTSHCLQLIHKTKSSLQESRSKLALYKHTYFHAKTVLTLTDYRVLPRYHDTLQMFGSQVFPLLKGSIGKLVKHVSHLEHVWEDLMFPPKTIRSLLNILYTKPLDLTLQSILVAYALMHLPDGAFDILQLRTLPSDDLKAVKSLYFFDQHQYDLFFRFLPWKSDVFEYCDVNELAGILVERKEIGIARQMLTLLRREYAPRFTSATKMIMNSNNPSDFYVNVSSDANEPRPFTAVLNDVLSHGQFVSVLKSLNNQERFDCLFLFIMSRGKLCDLLSAFGEYQKTATSPSPILEFMFFYAIKRFSDVELAASLAKQNTGDVPSNFNPNVPLSAQAPGADIGLLSQFFLTSDLREVPLGTDGHQTPADSEPTIIKTPPPKIHDVSDELLQQLRTPLPTPSIAKAHREVDAPRSILRSTKTETKTRKRIRFGGDDDTDAPEEFTNRAKLSFSEPSIATDERAVSPEKRPRMINFTVDADYHEGVAVFDISPPKMSPESTVQTSDAVQYSIDIPLNPSPSLTNEDKADTSTSFKFNPISNTHFMSSSRLDDPDESTEEPSFVSAGSLPYEESLPEEIADSSKASEDHVEPPQEEVEASGPDTEGDEVVSQDDCDANSSDELVDGNPEFVPQLIPSSPEVISSTPGSGNTTPEHHPSSSSEHDHDVVMGSGVSSVHTQSPAASPSSIRTPSPAASPSVHTPSPAASPSIHTPSPAASPSVHTPSPAASPAPTSSITPGCSSLEASPSSGAAPHFSPDHVTYPDGYSSVERSNIDFLPHTPDRPLSSPEYEDRDCLSEGHAALAHTISVESSADERASLADSDEGSSSLASDKEAESEVIPVDSTSSDDGNTQEGNQNSPVKPHYDPTDTMEEQQSFPAETRSDDNKNLESVSLNISEQSSKVVGEATNDRSESSGAIVSAESADEPSSSGTSMEESRSSDSNLQVDSEEDESSHFRQIIEQSDSESEEDFDFEVPSQVLPDSEWYRETFGGATELTFDFSVPPPAASLQRVTRSQSRKLTKLLKQNKETLKTTKPLQNRFLLRMMRAVKPEVDETFDPFKPVFSPLAQSPNSSFGSSGTLYSPNIPTASSRLLTSKKTNNPTPSSPTAPEKKGPMFTLKSKGRGVFRLESTTSAHAQDEEATFGEKAVDTESDESVEGSPSRSKSPQSTLQPDIFGNISASNVELLDALAASQTPPLISLMPKQAPASDSVLTSETDLMVEKAFCESDIKSKEEDSAKINPSSTTQGSVYQSSPSETSEKVSEHSCNERISSSTDLESTEFSKSSVEVEYSKPSVEVKSSKSSIELESSKASIEVESSKSSIEVESSKSSIEVESSKSSIEVESSKSSIEIESSKSMIEVESNSSPATSPNIPITQSRWDCSSPTFSIIREPNPEPAEKRQLRSRATTKSEETPVTLPNQGPRRRRTRKITVEITEKPEVVKDVKTAILPPTPTRSLRSRNVSQEPTVVPEKAAKIGQTRRRRQNASSESTDNPPVRRPRPSPPTETSEVALPVTRTTRSRKGSQQPAKIPPRSTRRRHPSVTADPETSSAHPERLHVTPGRVTRSMKRTVTEEEDADTVETKTPSKRKTRAPVTPKPNPAPEKRVTRSSRKG